MLLPDLRRRSRVTLALPNMAEVCLQTVLCACSCRHVYTHHVITISNNAKLPSDFPTRMGQRIFGLLFFKIPFQCRIQAKLQTARRDVKIQPYAAHLLSIVLFQETSKTLDVTTSRRDCIEVNRNSSTFRSTDTDLLPDAIIHLE